MVKIPVIDISKPKEQVAADLVAAYRDTGFAYITGHGIPLAQIDDVFDASARFHNLPRPEKMAIALNNDHRGFIPINTSTDVNSTLADVTKPNQSESFMMMRESQADGTYLEGPNQWPDVVGFQDTLMDYDQVMGDLGRRLMGLICLGLGVPQQRVLPAFDRPTSWLRLLHYPTQPAQAPNDLYGSAPHTDFGCLTLLAQDDVGGLEVMTPGGDWIAAAKIPGSFVVNVGDMLHRWSNGILKSTPHRVINASGKARYSCPYFFDPNVKTVIAPWPECVADGDEKFPPILFEDFLRSELEAGYDAHKAGTECA